eukprot:TRINITY_DN11977_c0_g1_i4.p1 TRINITY_DN11977_c0_g1~~TRINITY_DN11977_c0_g1_i4.p1  ORF type:complete len:2376 (+),score=609.90 TRINITY_DN11977_c0_g1_i4:85-7212(+)
MGLFRRNQKKTGGASDAHGAAAGGHPGQQAEEPPLLEESVTAEGQPGTTVGSFTYPDFQASRPPELDPGPGDGEAVEGGVFQKQVVVVGADPAGLTLALTLARQGIAVTLLDSRRSLASSSKSATWSAHTVELWGRGSGNLPGPSLAERVLKEAVQRRKQQLLLSAASGARGGKASSSKATGGDGPVVAAELEVEGRAGRWVSAYALHLQQYRVEKLLHDALQEVPNFEELVDIRWRSTAEEISSTADGVLLKVAVELTAGKPPQKYELAAAYAVVCSAAAKGVVRERVATPQPRGFHSVTRSVLTVDVKIPDAAIASTADVDRKLFLSGKDGIAESEWWQSGGVAWLAVSQRRHPDGQLRVDALLPAGVDLPRAAKREGAKALVQAMLGQEASFEILGCAAQQFRVGPMSSASKDGRLFFCGEALAVLSPFGGAGGNLGVQDAANLAWKLALVVLQGAPPSLLETYRVERDAAHTAAAERQLRAEQVLAPATSADSEARQVAIALLRAGQELGAALLRCGGVVPVPARLHDSPLVVRDTVDNGAAFQASIPRPGDVFVDAAVEDLQLESETIAGKAAGGPSNVARGYLLGHAGAFFTLVVFARTTLDIPWEGLKSVDRSRLTLTLDLVRKVVVILDASRLERMSDAHVEAIGRAKRLETLLLADRNGSAAAAYDARPGTTFLIRPDLCVAARWRELRPRDVHSAFLHSTGHLLHTTAVRPAASPLHPAFAPASEAGKEAHPLALRTAPRSVATMGGLTDELLHELAGRLAEAPEERRLAVVSAALLLLANHAGSLQVAHEALKLASAAVCALPAGPSTPAKRAVGAEAVPPGSADGEKAATCVALEGRLARLFEADEDESDLEEDVRSVAATSPRRDDDSLWPSASGDPPTLVPSEAAADSLRKLLSEDAEVLCSQIPRRGAPALCERLAAELSEAEDLDIEADCVMVADGSCTVLTHLLACCGAKAGGEILIIGPCPAHWRPALQGYRLRHCDTAAGGQHDFSFRSEDVEKNVAADTCAVLMCLYNIGSGVAPAQEEVERLGHFVDFEASRRKAKQRPRTAGSERGRQGSHSTLCLLVDATLRSQLLDTADGGHEPPRVLEFCRQAVLFGDVFGDCSPAAGLEAQFAAVSPGSPLVEEILQVELTSAATTRSGLVQALAAALPAESQVFESLRRRREILAEAVTKAGIAVIGGRPQAGRFLCGRLPEDVDEEAYCAELSRQGVAADRGAPWGFPGCVRLHFGEQFSKLEASLPIFSTVMRQLRHLPPAAPGHAGAAAPLEFEAVEERGDEPSEAEAKSRQADAAEEAVAPSPASSPPGAAGLEEAESAASPTQKSEGDVAAAERAELPPEAAEGAEEEKGPKAAAKEKEHDDIERTEAEEANAATEEVKKAAEESEDDYDADADGAALEQAKKEGKSAPLAAQLRRGAKGIACAAQLSGSITVELIAQAGFEVVIVDHENGPGDFGNAASLVRSALGAGAHVLLRLADAEISFVRRALEAGVEGVILPRVTSAVEAEEFGAMVRLADAKIRDDDAVEWSGAAPPDTSAEATSAAAAAAAAAASSEKDPAAAPFARPRPLIAVEIDPSCNLRVAEDVLGVSAIDLVLLDPERSMDAIAADKGIVGNANIAASNTPQAAPPTEAELAAGGAGGGMVDSADPATAFSPSQRNGVPAKTGFAARLQTTAMAGKTAVAAAAPLLLAAVNEAQSRYWEEFGKLPALAAERGRLVGCSAHSKHTAFELLKTGFSVVVVAADLELLREGAVRHTMEMKAENNNAAAGQKLMFATPLESARARLATGALVSQLRRQRKALGAFLHLGDPLAAELVALAGFEAIVIDHEQGPGDLVNAVSLIHAAASAGAHAFLRVPGQDVAYLRRALQLGMEGLILPRVESAAQAAEFVSLARKCWPASSLRGAAGPGAAALRPAAATFLRRRAEEHVLKACQIETEAGLGAVKEIARVEGIDMIFFNPVELAASAARGQEAGLLLALETAEAETKRAGKLLGGMSVPGRSVAQMFHSGYDLVCTTSDVILVRSAAENIVREAKPPASVPEAASLQWVESGRIGKVAGDDETLVARLKNNKKARVLGVFTRLGSAMAAELVSRDGFEVIVLDHARGPGELLPSVGQIHAAARAGAHALIRVPAVSHAHLRRALQIGVEGVILPGVEDARQAHELVELCLYPTKGIREDSHAAESRMKNQPFRRMDFSFAPPLVEFYGQRVAEFTRRQGEAMLIVAQVDSPTGAQNIREIAKVQGIDMIFLDATRLSGADVERVEGAVKDEGKLLGGLLVPGCTADQMFRMGYKLVCAASDCGLLGAGTRMCLRALRSGPSAPPMPPGGSRGRGGGTKKPSPAAARRKLSASPAPSPRPTSPM